METSNSKMLEKANSPNMLVKSKNTVDVNAEFNFEIFEKC